MKTIPLAGTDRVALVDDEDFPTVCCHEWRATKPSSTGNMHAYTYIRGTGLVAMHQMLKPTPGGHVHHNDGDGLNNCRKNLIPLTHVEHARIENNLRKPRKNAVTKPRRLKLHRVPTPAALDTTYTVEQAAELLHLHVDTVRRWIKSGKLPSAKPGKRHLIRQADLERLTREGLPVAPETAGG